MRSLSLKAVVIRYLTAVLLIVVAGLISTPKLFIIVPVAIVSVKLLIYDGIVAAIVHKLPHFNVSPWHLIGYGLTVIADMLFTYGAGIDQVDAGFAFLGTLLYSPWILAIALLIMIIATYLRRKR